ncbi:MAG: 2-amino-4-hydroxy-6-hydroxymethyldihydropteridine diphosphokinase [Lentisphaeria bacterium]|nr:2-amino-4-hydroxy-6-hydroxymethyldihydropteridine diphosphokinase [Lentisphaeria bacterium]
MTANTKKIILALGGNLGDVKSNFRKAFKLLANGGVKILGQSTIIETAPIDCPPDTPDFYNMAVIAETRLAPSELLKLCQQIEVALGRPADHGYHLSRTIDIDIIAIGNEKINSAELIVPHPQALNRDFVMLPIKNLFEQQLFSKSEFNFLCEKI